MTEGPGAEGAPPRSLTRNALQAKTGCLTLTTTGYGNLVPAANPGQSFAVGEMLIGQLFLVPAVAKAVSTWRPGPGRGRPPTDNDRD